MSTAQPAGFPQGQGGRVQLDAGSLAVDEKLAQLSATFRFLLDLTPVDASERRTAWLEGDHAEPVFTYRELSTDPDVVQATLDGIDLGQVGDPTVRRLLEGKHRELGMQARMLAARNTGDFLPLSVEQYGAVSDQLRALAKQVLDEVEAEGTPGERITATDFLALARAEIDWYQQQDPGVAMHAEVREDVNGVLVSGDTLLVGADSAVQTNRAQALLQHEIGTHLVTQVNGSAQPLRCLGMGLANYDETQEGLAVLAEIAVGQLTRTRLRQLAGRVLTVDAMVQGASFGEAWQQLVSRGFKRGSAWTTVMRVFRSGGFTKDACYLRGMVDLLAHRRDGGSLEALYLGKFSLPDLPLVEGLRDAGVLAPARITAHHRCDPTAVARLERAAHLPLAALVTQA